MVDGKTASDTFTDALRELTPEAKRFERAKLARVQAIQLRALAALVEETGEPIAWETNAESYLHWTIVANEITERCKKLETRAR